MLDLLALFQIAIDVLDLDRGVVDQDADGERQAAQGHDVDGLAQRREHAAASTRMDSGIETAMMSVLRQLPRKTRIMSAVRQAAMIAFAHHSANRGRARRSTDRRWAGSEAAGGSCGRDQRQLACARWK